MISRPAILRILCLVLLATASLEVHAQSNPNGTWLELSPTGTRPAERKEHGAIYDPIGDRMIIFGGYSPLTSISADAWFLSLGATSEEWIALPACPTPRSAMTTIYDPIRHRLVMFGGNDGPGFPNDVWVLNLVGTPAWTQLQPTGIGPSGRTFAAAVYDPVRDRMIIFGGYGGSNDVWALALSSPSWTQLTPTGIAPSPRYGHAAVYDPLGDRMVVFGGATGSHETWALSLNDIPRWTTIAPGPWRYLCTAIYDSRRQRMVVYGGLDGGALGDAWALSLVGDPTWTRLTPDGTTPTPRWVHSAVYQERLDRMIVYGGLTDGSFALDMAALDWGGPELPVPPSISGFEPVGGRIGDPVTIQGGGLDGAVDVQFNGESAPILSSTFSTIATQVPPGATSGPIRVVTPLGEATSYEEFFVGEEPVITSATPDSGKIGSTTVLQGLHFTGATRVAIGGTGATQFVVVSDEVIEATVDSLASTGPISVTTPAATGTSSFSFKVLPIDTSARIVSVKDVPADQGGKVVVSWLGSDLDVAPRRQITGYRIWRRAPLGTEAESARLTLRREVAANGDVVFWEPLALIPSAYREGYAYVAVTTQDSTADGNPHTAFLVQALTEDPFVFYDSSADSGYSVDNLAPPTPLPFTATYGPSRNSLHWTASRAPDLWEFRLYRGVTSGFEPDPSSLVAATKDTGYVDIPGAYFYKLTAVDIHGNQSLYATVSPDAPTATLASLVSVDALADRIRLLWYAGSLGGRVVSVYRRATDADWVRLEEIVVEEGGYLRFEDLSVVAGKRYGYRLGIQDGGEEHFVGEAWVTAEDPVFALTGVHPNPSRDGSVTVQFALARVGSATLEVFDVGGRRVVEEDVGALGPGRHVVRLGRGAKLSPGIYVVRLTQAGTTVSSRVSVLK